MQSPSSRARKTTTALLELEPDLLQPAICPLCHTTQAFSLPVADSDWLCVRCGQRWDAARLATVAEYAAWTLEREAAPRTREPA